MEYDFENCAGTLFRVNTNSGYAVKYYILK